MDKPALATFGLSEAEFQKYLQVKHWITDRLLYATAALVFVATYGFTLTTLLALKWYPLAALSTSLPSAFIVTVALSWLPFQVLRKSLARLVRQIWPVYGKAIRYERYCQDYEAWCTQHGVSPEVYITGA